MIFPLEVVADCIVNDRHLQGGRIYGRTYLIAIIETGNIVGIYEGKLRNNFRSQRSPAHPEGYQPFLIVGDYERDYDIKTKTFETIRIDSGKSFTGKYYINRNIRRQNACILKVPAQHSEQFYLLEKLRWRTSLQEQLRRSVSANSSDVVKLEIAAQLLQEAVLSAQPRVHMPALAANHKRFEFYLHQASDQVLADLLASLETGLPAGEPNRIWKSA